MSSEKQFSIKRKTVDETPPKPRRKPSNHGMNTRGALRGKKKLSISSRKQLTSHLHTKVHTFTPRRIRCKLVLYTPHDTFFPIVHTSPKRVDASTHPLTHLYIPHYTFFPVTRAQRSRGEGLPPNSPSARSITIQVRETEGNGCLNSPTTPSIVMQVQENARGMGASTHRPPHLSLYKRKRTQGG